MAAMQEAVLAFFAALMGAASVELFGRTFKGLLGALAAAVLFARKEIDARGLLRRLNNRMLTALACGAALALGLRIYLQEQGLGTTGLEQAVYFLACTWRMAAFIRTVRADVEAMFDCSD
ncbi:MAG: hypothetical protein AB1916_02155 [Thermodesulfobacteriota bacterium]